MTRPAILLFCVQNAGRSQMAAAWARHFGGDAVDVLAGGSEPADRVHPPVVDVTGEVGSRSSIHLCDAGLGHWWPRTWRGR